MPRSEAFGECAEGARIFLEFAFEALDGGQVDIDAIDLGFALQVADQDLRRIDRDTAAVLAAREVLCRVKAPDPVRCRSRRR